MFQLFLRIALPIIAVFSFCLIVYNIYIVVKEKQKVGIWNQNLLTSILVFITAISVIQAVYSVDIMANQFSIQNRPYLRMSNVQFDESENGFVAYFENIGHLPAQIKSEIIETYSNGKLIGKNNAVMDDTIIPGDDIYILLEQNSEDIKTFVSRIRLKYRAIGENEFNYIYDVNLTCTVFSTNSLNCSDHTIEIS